MNQTARTYCKVFLNLLTAGAAVLFVLQGIPRLLRFFWPFAVAAVIAFVANPLVRFLDEKLKIRRKAGSAIVIVTAIALVLLAGYGVGMLLYQGVRGFIGEIPQLLHSLQEGIAAIGKGRANLQSFISPDLEQQLANQEASLLDYLGQIADKLGSPTVAAVGNIAKGVPSFFVGIVMCLLSSYFFISQRTEIGAWFYRMLPESFRQRWGLLFSTLKTAVGGYFKAQLKIEFWIYLLLAGGFLILRVKFALIIALAIALLDFLPVFGTGFVLLPWALVCVLIGNYRMALGLLAIWGVSQMVRQIIQPKIVGDSVGLPAIPTLFLLFIGYRLGSVWGMLLSVPAGILVVTMYKAGFFTSTLDSLRILVEGFNRFRKLTDEDKRVGKP